MRLAERLPLLAWLWLVAPVSIARRERLGPAVAWPFGLIRDLAALGLPVPGGSVGLVVARRDDALTYRPPVAIQDGLAVTIPGDLHASGAIRAAGIAGGAAGAEIIARIHGDNNNGFRGQCWRQCSGTAALVESDSALKQHSVADECDGIDQPVADDEGPDPPGSLEVPEVDDTHDDVAQSGGIPLVKVVAAPQ